MTMPRIGVANVYSSDDYERGYRQGFKDGMEFSRNNNNIPILTLPNDGFTQDLTGCNVCGIKFGTGAWGYVCHHPKCPTKVTC